MELSKITEKTILVLGGTGKTGSRIIQRLRQLNCQVRVGSRSAEIPFDWDNQTTWEAALHDIDAVYVSFQPDLAVPRAVGTIRSFIQMALEAGVKKLVLLSGRGEPEAQQCEQVVMDSGADWTILRASWFCQNFSESYLLEPILAGYVALPAGDIGEPFIDVEDIADVAMEALKKEGHTGKIYELTGFRLLTFKDALAEISRATGKPVQYQEVSIDGYTALLNEYGITEEYISLLTYLYTEVLDGRNANVTDDIQRVLGRKPTDFSEYVKRTAATGIWEQALV